MNVQTPSIPRQALEAPFPPGLVKSRPGAFGASLSYLEGHSIIGRLNEAFDGAWSFEIVSHQVLDDEVLVCGKFRAEAAGIVKMAFGSSKITRDQRTGAPIALGDDLKAAATDALKKAATLLGVGLYLYAGPVENADDHPRQEEPMPRSPRSNGNGQDRPQIPPPNGNGSSRITNKQISAIFAIARDRGMSNADVRALAQATFDRTIDYLSKVQASQLIEHLLGQ